MGETSSITYLRLLHPDTLDSLERLARMTPDGCFVEIGVYQGGSAVNLAEVARERGNKVFLYDTFTGIPMQDEVDPHVVGDFGDTSADAVRKLIPDAEVIEGLFPDTLIDMPPVAFVHADCDQYQSVLDVCQIMPKHMVKGGIILFDDYGCLEGATKAVEESFPKIWLTPQGRAFVIIE